MLIPATSGSLFPAGPHFADIPGSTGVMLRLYWGILGLYWGNVRVILG